MRGQQSRLDLDLGGFVAEADFASITIELNWSLLPVRVSWTASIGAIAVSS